MLSDLGRPPFAVSVSVALRRTSDDTREPPGLGGGVARGVIGPGRESIELAESQVVLDDKGRMGWPSSRLPIGGELLSSGVEELAMPSQTERA